MALLLKKVLLNVVWPINGWNVWETHDVFNNTLNIFGFFTLAIVY